MGGLSGTSVVPARVTEALLVGASFATPPARRGTAFVEVLLAGIRAAVFVPAASTDQAEVDVVVVAEHWGLK